MINSILKPKFYTETTRNIKLYLLFLLIFLISLGAFIIGMNSTYYRAAEHPLSILVRIPKWFIEALTVFIVGFSFFLHRIILDHIWVTIGIAAVVLYVGVLFHNPIFVYSPIVYFPAAIAHKFLSNKRENYSIGYFPPFDSIIIMGVFILLYCLFFNYLGQYFQAIRFSQGNYRFKFLQYYGFLVMIVPCFTLFIRYFLDLYGDKSEAKLVLLILGLLGSCMAGIIIISALLMYNSASNTWFALLLIFGVPSWILLGVGAKLSYDLIASAYSGLPTGLLKWVSDRSNLAAKFLKY